MIETSLPLPDFQKDIKVGDLSFVYKGVYHPIHWEGDIPYRPRVENIVVKNGREIFLRVYDSPKPGFEYKYRLPGGSLDNDSTKIQQAENETNEEALLKVKNINVILVIMVSVFILKIGIQLKKQYIIEKLSKTFLV